MKREDILNDLTARTGRAVARYWETRATQRNKQKQTEKADQGLLSAVTGGAQMDGLRIPIDIGHRFRLIHRPLHGTHLDGRRRKQRAVFDVGGRHLD